MVDDDDNDYPRIKREEGEKHMANTNGKLEGLQKDALFCNVFVRLSLRLIYEEKKDRSYVVVVHTYPKIKFLPSSLRFRRNLLD